MLARDLDVGDDAALEIEHLVDDVAAAASVVDLEVTVLVERAAHHDSLLAHPGHLVPVCQFI